MEVGENRVDFDFEQPAQEDLSSALLKVEVRRQIDVEN